MKTIAQIASEIGVSKQAVSDKIAKLGLQRTLQKNGNRFVVSPSDEILIKSAFSHIDHKNIDKQNDNTNDNQSPSISDLISMLQKELEIKNEQIRELNSRLADTTAALVNAQQLALTAQGTAQVAQALHANTMKQIAPELPQEDTQEIIITPSPTDKRVGFIGRIFGRR